jgi:hypothetical protein
MFPRDMVCLRNISGDTLHKGNIDDDDNDDDNNNNNNLAISYHKLYVFIVRIPPEVVGHMLRVIS